jgi:ABC-type multidrug transport system fused ATPase/permease subunit
MSGQEPRKIAFLANQLQGRSILKQETLSDIQVYKDTLAERFALAPTSEELDRLIQQRRKIQELDREASQLNYAKELAKIQIQDAKQKAIFQRSQQVVASVVSIIIGLYCMQVFPLASLLFLVLGLARPLGYSLGEISELFGGLTGFSKESDKIISNENIQEIQSEEPTNERY